MKRRRRFSKEFKAQATEMVENGREVTEVARDLEIDTGLLYRWCRQARAETAKGGSAVWSAGGDPDGADELRRLRRENALLRSENVILKKAAVILGTEPQSRAGK